MKVSCIAKFSDEMRNEIKSVTIESYKTVGKMNKVMQSAKGLIKLIRINEIKIIIKVVIYNNVSDLFLKSENIPIIWKKSIS